MDEAKSPATANRSGAFVSCDGGIVAYRSVLGRPGSDRLSRVLRRSTMGAGGFNDRVRNGIGWNSPAMTTRPAKNGLDARSAYLDLNEAPPHLGFTPGMER